MNLIGQQDVAHLSSGPEGRYKGEALAQETSHQTSQCPGKK